MKKLLWLVLALILAVVLGLFIKNHPGYTAFEIQGWSIEMPIWLALFAVLVSFLVLYALLRGLFYILGMKSRYQKQLKQKREIFLRFKTEQALLAITIGDYAQAEDYLLEAANKHPRPFIQYLTCAHAAQEQGDSKRAADYLLKAKQTAPEDSKAADIAEAELLLISEQPDAALIKLKHLQRLDPKNQQIIKLLLKTYGLLGDWHQVLNLIAQLDKKKTLNHEQNLAIEIKVYQELLNNAATHKEAASLAKTWAHCPKALQKEPAVIAAYVRGLLQLNDQKTAEHVLRSTLKKTPHSELLLLYSDVNFDPHTQLATAEGWLKAQQDQDPILLLCLGRLCKHNQLWGKAKAYLEQAAKLAPSATVYQELGSVYERLHDEAAALAAYKKGLENQIVVIT